MSKAYKNLFDFVYTVLGRSPGGEYKNGIMTFHHTKLSFEEFENINNAWDEYIEWFETSEEKSEKRIPNVMFEYDLKPHWTEGKRTVKVVGDTTWWK